MKLDSLLSVFKKPPVESGGSGDATIRVARRGRDLPDRSDRPQQQSPQPAPDEPVDTVQISVQATFVLAASQYDPRSISVPEAQRLADQLLQGGAISRRERDVISSGPRTIETVGQDPFVNRDLLSGFQEQLAADVGRSDLRSIDESTRAVSILGRVATLREAIA